jgi:hypothetical protein
VLDLDIVAFGGGLSRYRSAVRRLGREARESGVFSGVQVMTPKALDSGFRENHRKMLRSSARGYGYWIWKPHVISTALDVSRSEFLLYLDAGCTLNLGTAAARSRLSDYLDFASDHSVCSFFLPQNPEEEWTKRDLLDHLGITAEHRESGQRIATAIVFKRSRESREILEMWDHVSTLDSYRLLDDSPSRSTENERFVNHRHDQSVLSCILKSIGTPALQDETYFADDWFESGRNFPIWATRFFRRWAYGSSQPLLVRACALGIDVGEKAVRQVLRR